MEPRFTLIRNSYYIELFTVTLIIRPGAVQKLYFGIKHYDWMLKVMQVGLSNQNTLLRYLFITLVPVPHA